MTLPQRRIMCSLICGFVEFVFRHGRTAYSDQRALFSHLVFELRALYRHLDPAKRGFKNFFEIGFCRVELRDGAQTGQSVRPPAGSRCLAEDVTNMSKFFSECFKLRKLHNTGVQTGTDCWHASTSGSVIGRFDDHIEEYGHIINVAQSQDISTAKQANFRHGISVDKSGIWSINT